MQRVFYLVLFLSVGMVLLAISKNSPVQSQELPRITELSDSDELFLNSLEEEDVDDFAPDVDGYLLPSRGWVENLVENRAVLAFERPGVLEYVEPRDGDLVESGMIVAHLKDDVAQAQHNIHLKEASNTVDKRYALKASEVAKVKYERALNVNQKIKGTYPEIELREYKLDAERATLQIEQAEHQQAVAELTAQESAVQLKTFDLKAPFSGTIIKVYKSKGEAVNQGDPVVELLNIDTVRVNSWINRDIAHQIKRGEKVLVKLLIDEKDNEFPGSDQILEGKVQYIDLKTGGSSRKRVKIGVDVQNQDHLLLPGSAVALKIVR